MDTSDASLRLTSLREIDREKEKEHFIALLDAAYAVNEPLGIYVTQMIEAEFTKAERNTIIMASDYAQDEKIRDAIELFGF